MRGSISGGSDSLRMVSTFGKDYQVIVVGAGHAGCEAALAAARMGCRTLLLNMSLDMVAQMSCNPAIGGLAKGHLVREIDALGGEMARAIDATGIQFRILNTRKGPAVRASRAQADRHRYAAYMKKTIEDQDLLDLKQGAVVRLLVEGGAVVGVETREGLVFRGLTVILTTGTFLRGLIHVGLNQYPGGRAGEPASVGLSANLESFGLAVGRLKTGTPARLDRRTINFASLEAQHGDDPPRPFSVDTKQLRQPQVPCHITWTNSKTHEVIRGGLDRSPLYSGVIEGVGPRYCPSIEDKVVRFPDKERHQVFLEPEGLGVAEVYPNGVSTSLPADVQLAFLRTLPGLEQVEIMRPGYAIEYDFVNPLQLRPTLETKALANLFHAGQINGTSGYEEAAAQGLMAGINAALRVSDLEPLVIGRNEAYIGVLIDDLVTLGTEEPYRMFTSRAEYRLLLREDNAEQRLTAIGHGIALIPDSRWRNFCVRQEGLEKGRDRLRAGRVGPGDEEAVARLGLGGLQNAISLEELLRRPGIHIGDLQFLDPELTALDDVVSERLEIETKYAGYIRRQMDQVERFRRLEDLSIPPDFAYRGLPGLSMEIREKLETIRPLNLGQAARIPGVTPAAVAILTVVLRQK